MTSLSNSFESIFVTLSIPKQDSDIIVIADIYVIAPNQNNSEET